MYFIHPQLKIIDFYNNKEKRKKKKKKNAFVFILGGRGN